MGALWYGGYQVISGALTPGEFFSFTAAVVLLYGPVRQLSRMVNTVQQSIASVERVFEILDTPPAIVDAPGAHALPGFTGSIVLRGRRLPLSGGGGLGAAGHHADRSQGRAGRLRGHVAARARPP